MTVLSGRSRRRSAGQSRVGRVIAPNRQLDRRAPSQTRCDPSSDPTGIKHFVAPQVPATSRLSCNTLQADSFCRTDAGWNCQEMHGIRATKFEATPATIYKSTCFSANDRQAPVAAPMRGAMCGTGQMRGMRK